MQSIWGKLRQIANVAGSKQGALNRVITVDDSSASTTVTDTGGAITVPLHVVVAAPVASATQTNAGTISIRAAFKTLIDNIAHLFTNAVLIGDIIDGGTF